MAAKTKTKLKGAKESDDKKYSKMQEAKKQLIALFGAAEKGCLEDLKMLVDSHTAFYAKEENIDLASGDEAVARCRVGVVRSFLDGRKRNALHFAAFKGHTHVVSWFADVAEASGNRGKAEGFVCDSLLDTQDIDGATPLVLAINAGAQETAELLVSRGADPKLATKAGATALHAAAGMGFETVLRAAVAGGCAVDDASSEIGAPLHWATGRGHAGCAAALLEMGADPGSVNAQGVPALVMAAARNSLSTVQLLLQRGADLSQSAPGPVTALTVAADAGNHRMVEVVLANCDAQSLRAACDQVDGEGLRPVEVAQWSDHAEVVAQLLPLTTRFADADAVAASVAEKKRAREAEAAATKAAAEAEKAWQPTPDQWKRSEECKDRGNAFFVRKELADAARCYTEGLEINPRHCHLLSNRAMCRLGLGDARAALADAEAAVECAPKWNKAYYRVGQCHMALEQYTDAAQVLWKGYMLGTEDKGAKSLQKLFQEAVKLGKRKHQGKEAVARSAEGGSDSDSDSDDDEGIPTLDSVQAKKADKKAKKVEKFDHVLPIEVPVGRLSEGKFNLMHISFNNDDSPAERAGQFVDNFRLDRSLIAMIARRIAKVQKEAKNESGHW
jgi:ankyrin repeat protein